MRSLNLTTYASRVFAKLKDFAQKVNSNSKTKQRSKNLVPHYISLKFASLKLIFTPKLMEDDFFKKKYDVGLPVCLFVCLSVPPTQKKINFPNPKKKI